MIRQAVILVPGAAQELASYLFSPVAGVPFLPRQILGLTRVGITNISILAPIDIGKYLTQEFARKHYFSSKIQIISRWSDSVASEYAEVGTGYFFTLLVNTLPDQHILMDFFQSPPPAGALTLGVLTQPQNISPIGAKSPAKGPDKPPTVKLNNGLVISLNLSGSTNGFPLAGLTLVSTEAWKDWQDWQKQQDTELLSSQNVALDNFYNFLAQKVKKNQVLGRTLDSSGILSVYDDQDQAVATAHLIAAQNNSPMGEGFLENSWNRKIARLILPWLLTRGITPNQITLTSFLVGLLAVWGFAHGSYGASVGAALLLPLILVLDCLDGAVARLKFQESRLGALLDLHGDSVLNLLLFLSIILGSYRSSGQPLFLVAGLLLTIGYLACWWLINPGDIKPIFADQPPDSQKNNSKKVLREAVSRDFFYIILLMAILNWLDWMIVGMAVGTNIFALIYYWRQSNG